MSGGGGSTGEPGGSPGSMEKGARGGNRVSPTGAEPQASDAHASRESMRASRPSHTSAVVAANLVERRRIEREQLRHADRPQAALPDHREDPLQRLDRRRTVLVQQDDRARSESGDDVAVDPGDVGPSGVA